MPVMDGLEATRRIRKYEETGSWEIAEGEEGNKGAIVNSNDAPPDVRFASIPPSQSPIRQRVPILAVGFSFLPPPTVLCLMACQLLNRRDIIAKFHFSWEHMRSIGHVVLQLLRPPLLVRG